MLPRHKTRRGFMLMDAAWAGRKRGFWTVSDYLAGVLCAGVPGGEFNGSCPFEIQLAPQNVMSSEVETSRVLMAGSEILFNKGVTIQRDVSTSLDMTF
ncbi:hypothetical protein EJV47_15685 [Hymenobacter gummosus]|uniref:Uncharacterized protein n=1 Tax=Hymenobacter gummosus TaxID=1776032 RepID=A0A3S0H579_9BACT|nr:hypothetical protein [Hymenobacter gummosus]RTQ48413.1 hypothetical protein EJV47_15685 [Hymenobacter gummosus]